MRKFIILCLMLLPGMIALAQQGPKLQVLTPPPPDVSALGKFGIVPVDNFTGVPSISIPVYTIKEGTLEFPVSLQYHAGGLKVKEEASEVGLGWALSAGGSIVSVTRGLPDFQGGFSNSYLTMPDPPNMQTKSPYYSLNDWYYLWKNDLNYVRNLTPEIFIFSGLSLNRNGAAREYINDFHSLDYYSQAPDYASDLYMITIGERSYKFIFDNNFKPVVLGDGSLKIELTYNGNYPDWKVTDETGTAYYFAQRQFNYSNTFWPPNNGGSLELNAWHLSKIVSPTYGEITFIYQHSWTEFTEPVPNVSQTYLVGNTSEHTQQQFNKIAASYTMYQQLNLDKIRFSSGYMKFYHESGRLDLKGAKRLQAIEVRDNNDRLVKKMTLDNNYYFTSYDDRGFSGIDLTGFTVDNWTKRLRLNAVSEVDVADPAKEKKYAFTYNENVNLPSKLSLQIDHWGHYNGASNSELVPPVTLLLSTTTIPTTLSGANRDANPGTMPANMLTSVQYPTGGSSSFTYETNQYPTTETVVTWHDEYSGMFKAAGSSNVQTSGFIDANGNFTVGSNWAGKKLQIVSILSNPTYPGNYEMDIIVRFNGSVWYRIPTRPPAGSNMMIDSSIILQEGTYNISYEADTYFFNTFEIRRSVYVLRAYSTSEQVNKTVYVGGLRTTKIKNTDPVTGNVNTKTFAYSGITLDNLPIYESLEGYDRPLSGFDNYFYYRYGQSIYPFSDGRMAPYLGYQKVEIREIDNNNNANGLSEYNYSISGSININAMIRANQNLNKPYICDPITAPIPDISSGYRGKLMSEKHYKLVNNINVPVSSSSYYYTSDNGTKVWQMLFNQGLSRIISSGPTSLYQEFKIYAHHFAINVNRNMLWHKEQSEYDASGNVTLTQYEDYTYDNVNGHYQLIKKTTKNSKGDILNTCYKYPQDYGDLTSLSNLDQESQGIKLLQQTHVVTPVETYKEQIKAGTTNKLYLGGQLNVFNTNLPTPKQVLALETPAPFTAFTPSLVNNGVFSKNNLYTNRIRFTQYDANGRLLEQKKESDVLHSYVWGYNNTYPVAEVTGASYNSFIGILNQSILQNPASDQALRNELQKIRQNNPTALVTTYTYRPLVGITSQTDAANRTTYYEYDGLGRLVIIRDQDGNVIKRFCYSYTGQQSGCDVVGNIFKSQNFTKQGCNTAAGEYGSTVPYTVDANTYFALTPEEANAKAQAEIDAKGQLTANTIGQCLQGAFNDPMSGTFTRQTCNANETPGTVPYSVPAGRYVAPTKAEANLLASADFYTNGQRIANETGSCTPIQYVTINIKSVYSYYPGPNKVEFLQNGIVVQTVDFPRAQNGSSSITLPAGSYTMRFTATLTLVSKVISYILDTSPAWIGEWVKPAGVSVTNTGTVTFTYGTTYNLTATNII